MNRKKVLSVNNVHVIDTHMHDMPRYNAAYIIDCGGKTVMIDCGYSAKWKITMNEIRALGFDPAKIDYLFITHAHLDHYGAAGQIAALNPNVIICSHLTGVQSLLDDTAIRAVEAKTIYVTKEQKSKAGIASKVPAKNIRIVEEGSEFDINGHRFVCYSTPGHRPGHMTYHYLNENILFISDLVGNCFPEWGAHYSLNGHGCNYVDTIHSLRRLKTKYPSYLAMGHWGISDEAQEIMDATIDMYQDILDHAKAIMEADQTESQTQKLADYYWEQIQPHIQPFVDNEDGTGVCTTIYEYATKEHIPSQTKRFAQYCQEIYFPELAYKG